MAHTGSGIPGGLGSQVGYKVETVYGNAVVVDNFIYVPSFGIKPPRLAFEPKSFMPGRMGKPTGMEVLAAIQPAEGPLPFEIGFTKRLKLLKWLHGGSTGPVQQGGTAAYLTTFTPSAALSDAGTSLTLQSGYSTIPGGVVEPMTFAGCKAKSFELACAKDELLLATVDVDAQSYTHATDLAVASYAEPTSWFEFTQCNIKRAGTTIAGAGGFTFSADNGLMTDRRLADGTGKKAEPVRTNQITATLAIEMEWAAIQQMDDLMTSTPQTYIVEFVGPQIAGAYYNTFRTTIQNGVVVGEAPEISGPEPIAYTLNVEARNDGTNPLWKVEFIGTETTI